MQLSGMSLTKNQEEEATTEDASRCLPEDYKMLIEENSHLKRIIEMKKEQVQKLVKLVEQLQKFPYESN